MKQESKKEKVLVKKFMVAISDDIFGEDVVQDITLFGELNVEKQQLMSFVGDAHFDTEIEAIKHIESMQEVFACIIQEVFVWELK